MKYYPTLVIFSCLYSFFTFQVSSSRFTEFIIGWNSDTKYISEYLSAINLNKFFRNKLFLVATTFAWPPICTATLAPHNHADQQKHKIQHASWQLYELSSIYSKYSKYAWECHVNVSILRSPSLVIGWSPFLRGSLSLQCLTDKKIHTLVF